MLIVGPSGSGKSTLAHCINGLVPNSYKGDVSGSLMRKGKNPAEEGIFGISKLVGTVLQDPDSQFIGLTVAEEIAFTLENDCIEQDKMKKRVEECAKLVGVDKILKQSPHELSGGQKQRVAIAGVMTDGEVDILLFDEPLANLDPAAGKYAIDLIDKIHKETDTTIIIIEHRLEDVLHRDVDRIIVVNEGRIIADTTPNELLSSTILKEAGIREPLYITAMKYAGCEIDERHFPANLEVINFKPYKNKVNEWFCSIERLEEKTIEDQILSIDNVSFSYDNDKETLKDITFSTNRGEMISIVGRNGLGK